MTRIEVAEKTIATFIQVFGNKTSINEQTSANDLEKWDSLNHIILIQNLEKTFGIGFDLFEIIEIRDVAAMVNYIFTKTGE